MATTPQDQKWMALQRKIFSRWVASKLETEGEIIKDVVDDLTGWNLAKLMEILSDQECSYMRKITRKCKVRAQKLDAGTLALRFATDLGVEMRVPATSENIVDGDAKQVLGLVWALMRRFIRFSDDGGVSGPSPQESLLMWVNSQVSTYNLPALKKYGSELHDGMILAALVHKHRPKLIDFAELSPSNKAANLAKVFAAAEKYFGLEQFLSVEEFHSLDEKSMFIYVSEFFYGVARMRKFELAAKRIARLIDFTRTNDGMKLQYNSKAQQLRDHLDKVMGILNDRTIDNTMAGARNKLDQFAEYKEKDKSEIAGQYLDVESFYNHLALRLSDHNRPAYSPPAEVSAKGLGEALKQLEKTEQERSVALHKELNRQIKLVQESDSHSALLAKLSVWSDAKKVYLNTFETITTVGEASYNLTMLNAYDDEAKKVHEATKAAMVKISSFLEREFYENMTAVKEREATADSTFDPLNVLSIEKRRVLDDHLAREMFNEKLRLMDEQHVLKCQNIDSFNDAQTAYLNKRVSVDTVEGARAATVELTSHHSAIEDYKNNLVPAVKEYGARVCAQKYATAYSCSSFQECAALAAREQRVDEIFAALGGLHAEKNKVLEDDMAREVFKSKTLLENASHAAAFAMANTWCDEKLSYAARPEDVHSVADAQSHLAHYATVSSEVSDFLSHTIANFKALGAKVTAAKYSGISEWVFPTPECVAERELAVDARLVTVTEACAEKLAILEDHLAREEFKVMVRMWDARHAHMFGALQAWCAEKEAYLANAEAVNSVADANRHLALLDSFLEDRAAYDKLQVGGMNAMGSRIREAKFDNLSQWVFETPEEVSKRESDMAGRFAAMLPKADTKRGVLTEALDLENRKEVNRAQYATQAGEYRRWVAASCEAAAETHFGFTLLEVEEFAKELDLDDKRLKEESEVKQVAMRTTFESGVSLGITANCYTSENAESLTALHNELESALSKRRGAYAAALDVQRANDQLCKNFASAIEKFSSTLAERRATVLQNAAPLEVQLASVQLLVACNAEKDELPKLNALEDGLKAKEITVNIHTFLTAKDAAVLLTQYGTFLQRKSQMINEQITVKQRRGLSVEQFQEIAQQFDTFDVSKDGKLEAGEIRGCLFSLGEELSSKAVTAILEKHGDPSKTFLSKSGFTSFMIENLGDQATQEEALRGFVLINRGRKAATNERMDLLADSDLEFINKTAPALEDGWDYAAWVAEVYSR